jgi:hypothetical protein
VLSPLAASPCLSLFPWASFPVVFVAAVFGPLAVAQYAPLAVPPAWELAPERGVPQAVPRVEQGDQQAAQSVPCASLVAQSGVSRGDPLAVHSAPDELLAVHLVPCELPAVHSVALLGGPLTDCSAAHLADDHCLPEAVNSAACSAELQTDPLAGSLAA